MRVSRKAQYACIAMVELAANHGQPQPVRVRAIAEAHEIPSRFLVQILIQLKAAGLVVSIRGASGGYQLARSPEQISLADVIRAVHDKEIFKPLPPPVGTTRSPAVQAIHTAWKEVQAAEQRMLEDLTLAELMRRIQQGSSLSYQI
jgi:Rrf2 family protein